MSEFLRKMQVNKSGHTADKAEDLSVNNASRAKPQKITKKYREGFYPTIKALFYVFALMLPLWVLPLKIEVAKGREITFSILALLIFILWLFSILQYGKVILRISPIFWLGLALVLFWTISSFFSKSFLISTVFSNAYEQKLITIVFGFVLFLTAASVFNVRKELLADDDSEELSPAVSNDKEETTGRQRRTNFFSKIFPYCRSFSDADKFLISIIVAGSAVGIIALLQIFGIAVYQRVLPFAQGVDFNAIGSIYGLAVFFAVLLCADLGFLMQMQKEDSFRKKGTLIKLLFIAAGIIFFAALLVINFYTAWMVFLGGGLVLFGFALKNIRERRSGFDNISLFLTALLVAAGVMVLIRPGFIQIASLPSEVNPSFSGTIEVVKKVYKESLANVFIGTGPGTFGLDWLLYKNPQINQTPFWNVRFEQGSSFVLTTLAIVGILGAAVLVIFWVVSLFVSLRESFWYEERFGEAYNSLPYGLFAGFFSTGLALFLYPANYSFILLLFIFAGVLSAVLAAKRNGNRLERSDIEKSEDLAENAREGKKQSLSPFAYLRKTKIDWSVKNKVYVFERPWSIFLSSLLVVFILVLSTAGLYYMIEKLFAAYNYSRGVDMVAKGKVGEAVILFDKALSYDSKDMSILRSALQARIEQVKEVIERAKNGEKVGEEFQKKAGEAIMLASNIVSIYPQEPSLRRMRASLYSLIIPYLEGAENLAFADYKKVAELSPLNPDVFTDWALAKIFLADRIKAMLPTVSEQEKRSALQKLYQDTLADAKDVLKKAIEVKPDFALAHLLFAQVYMREGDLASVIKSVEDLRSIRPFDVGIAFQLGLLYYQSGRYDDARKEFERAVTINENYSNARYFLGLLYDREGKKDKAIEQFEKIEKLNPDNQEVKQILSNLRSGEPALAGIVPPAAPPEKREKTPISTEQSDQQ